MHPPSPSRRHALGETKERAHLVQTTVESNKWKARDLEVKTRPHAATIQHCAYTDAIAIKTTHEGLLMLGQLPP